MSTAKFQWLLRMGDTALILSQRLGEWCGKGPALEEDMALTNTALDLLGQARLWLTYAAEVEGGGRDEDQLAYLRESREFFNLLLVERPNGNYAHTLMRQFLFDAWHHLLLVALKGSNDSGIAEIAEKALKEVQYHLRRSSDLVVRLGDGTEQSHAMMQAALESLWTYTGEMFAGDEIDRDAAESGYGIAPDSLKSRWSAYVREVLDGSTLGMPATDTYMQLGGKQGRHTEDHGYLLAEMQVLQRTHPGAQW